MPSLKKTKNLQLSQWAGNEYVSFNDIAEDNAKIDVAVGNKVDKEEGKGLSSNDYTNAEKAKVGNIPENLDEYFGQQLSHILPFVEQISVTKVDKEEGKGLSSNDYTSADKAKVANLPANTNLEIQNLKQSVVSGKGTIATAINDLSGTTVANSSMTHSDLAVAIRNNLLGIKRIFKNGSQLSSGVRMVLRAFSTNRWSGFTYTESDINKYGSLSNNEIIIKGTWTGQGIVIFTNYIDFRNFNDLLVKYELTGSAQGFVEIGVLSSIPSVKKQGESLIEKPTFARSVKVGNTLESALVSLKDISGGYIGIVGGSEQYEATTKILEISLLKS